MQLHAPTTLTTAYTPTPTIPATPALQARPKPSPHGSVLVSHAKPHPHSACARSLLSRPPHLLNCHVHSTTPSPDAPSTSCLPAWVNTERMCSVLAVVVPRPSLPLDPSVPSSHNLKHPFPRLSHIQSTLTAEEFRPIPLASARRPLQALSGKCPAPTRSLQARPPTHHLSHLLHRTHALRWLFPPHTIAERSAPTTGVGKRMARPTRSFRSRTLPQLRHPSHLPPPTSRARRLVSISDRYARYHALGFKTPHSRSFSRSPSPSLYRRYSTHIPHSSLPN